VDAVYFDFAKAFDSVSYRKLLHKLTAYGITGDLLHCFKMSQVASHKEAF